jgi:uncharacterized tellurite resistance protein B-like protein
MQNFQQIEHKILAHGKADNHDLESLRRVLYSHGKIDRQMADSLVALFKRVTHRTPAFEQFFYQAIKDHLLADSRIGSEQVVWLRQLVFADGKIADEERKLLQALKGEAKHVCLDFEMLFEECMNEPAEQRTCG